MQTETLDKLYLEWSQFTRAKTERELKLVSALDRIAQSNPNKFEDPVAHVDWVIQQAKSVVDAFNANAI